MCQQPLARCTPLVRQASLQGLREEKPASETIRDTTMASAVAPEHPQSSVKLTHPDRLYWPDVGVTKEGLADYYAEVWRFIATFIVGRPLALVRCPTGSADRRSSRSTPGRD